MKLKLHKKEYASKIITPLLVLEAVTIPSNHENSLNYFFEWAGVKWHNNDAGNKKYTEVYYAPSIDKYYAVDYSNNPEETTDKYSKFVVECNDCLLYTSPSPRDRG